MVQGEHGRLSPGALALGSSNFFGTHIIPLKNENVALLYCF